MQADYVTVVEDGYDVRKISSPITFGQNWLTLQHGLSATAELLVSGSIVIGIANTFKKYR